VRKVEEELLEQGVGEVHWVREVEEVHHQ